MMGLLQPMRTGVKARVKALALSTGTYRPAQWIFRHVLMRSKLRAFRDEQKLYAPFVRRGDLVFDVGANAGVKSEVFLSLGARVVAFEPMQKMQRELAARCGGGRPFVAVRAAVGAAAGSAQLYVQGYDQMSSLLPAWGPESVGVETVPVTTLDLAIREHGKPAFCKIDVEGYELEVLKGLSEPLRALSFEYHQTPEGLDKTEQCVRYLAALGAVTLNVAPYASTTFLFPGWLTPQEFLAKFRAAISAYQGPEWGDVYATGTDFLAS
jgi:FkbM family methyltransferase